LLKLIRNRAGLVLAALVAALCPMLMAPTGGFPFTPTFGQVTIVGAPGFGHFEAFGPGVGGLGMVGVANAANGMCGSPAVSGDVCLRASAGRILASTNNGASSADISPADSGAVSISLALANSTCSVAGGTGTLQLHKIGKIVSATSTVGANCTITASTQMSTTNTPIPAAYRPVAPLACGAMEIQSAATPTGGFACVGTGGNLTVTVFGSATVTNLGFPTDSTFTYTLD
jgi:hypothetical protein